ncbi:MAG: YcaO-like family protein [Acuticoccus sp.]
MTDKRFLEGTRRAVPPEVTWRRLKPLLPVLGISRVAGITGLDRIGIPVFTAVRPNGRSLSVFQGKGLTLEAARVSAVMEAFETWCAEAIVKPVLFASLDEMRFQHTVVDVARLPVATLEPVDPGLPFLWIEGTDLLSGDPRFVPYEMVHANYSLPEPAHSGAFVATTNGLASGNTRDEALLHALCEVIERDAVTLWKLTEDAFGSRHAVAPQSVADPGCRWLLDRFAAAGVRVALFDATSDVGLPVFAALIAEGDGGDAAPELGFGCHPAPEVALSRALTEAAQARLTFIAGAREDIPDADYTPAAIAERAAAAAAIFADLAPTRDFAAIASVERDSIAGDIAATLDALRCAGIEEVVAVDIGRPAFGLSVIRVVVPGLEAALEGPRSQYVPGARASAQLMAAVA